MPITFKRAGQEAVTLENVSFKGVALDKVTFKRYGQEAVTVFEKIIQLATPQNVTADGTTVSWNAVENATSYEVLADGASIGSVTTSTGDLTTLPGWASLSTGSHNITIVAKADGYRDSEPSAAVSVEKAAEAYTDCLTFTGETTDFTLKATHKTWDGTLYWSTDHTNWTILTGTEAIQSVNKKLYLRGKGNTTFYYYDGELEWGVQWQLSSLAKCNGNIQTLLDYENPPTSISQGACYHQMFWRCANLITPPELPATTLSFGCYSYMFWECTNLIKAPELPATILTGNCYYYMFSECTKLKVNTTSGNKIFTCPSNVPSDAVYNMFSQTGGTFTGTPTAGSTYYWTE